MLIELAIASGFGYLVKRHRSRKKLIDYIKPELQPPPTSLRKFKRRYLDPFIGDSRQTHHLALRGEEAQKLSEAEHQVKNNLLIMIGAFGLATVGTLGYPIFYMFGSLPILYHLVDYVRMSYHDLTVKNRLTDNAVTVFFLTFALAGGFFFELTFGGMFVMLIRYLTIKTEDHSKRSLVNLFGEQPRSVWVLVDGVELQLPFEKLHQGDTIIVHAGQMIPADGTIIQGTASIDQHMLTGEAQPVEKTVGEPVFNATVVLSGHLHIQVEHTGTDTVAAQVGNILNQTTDFKEVLQSRAQDIIDQVTLPTVIFSGITWAALGLSQALGVLMVYPGYRLLFLNPLSMLSFLHLSAQHGILIKDGRSLEQLTEIDTVVFDKTGTLTLEKPHVKRVHCCATWNENQVLQFAAAAEAKQSHPIAQAILEETQHRQLVGLPIEEADYKIGFGIQVNLNGQVVRVGSRRFMTQEAIVIPPAIQNEQDRCHEYGHSLVMVAVDDRLIGAIELEPTLRPEASTIIRQLKTRGLQMVIISGDHEAPTRHLAERVGIDRYFAEVLPEEKANLVEQLERQGRKVCFVGDGINDAIALKKATTSISLRGATTIATDTAQVVLMEGNLRELGRLFELAESYQHNIRVNFVATMAPTFLYIGGAYLFGWGFMTAIILQQGTSAVALLNVVRPLTNEPEPKSLMTA